MEKAGANARIIELVEILNRASHAYYNENREIMSNLEYDRLYDELEQLEKESGVIYSNSPTQNVGYEVVEELPKEQHNSQMLSLDKTKIPEELRDFLGEQTGLLSWKLDGLTVVLTYEKGVLKKAVTRGNGEVGEVITPNARVFVNLPAKISFQGTLIIRGEAVISYADFEKINESLPENQAKYKNPRNLCSGSVRQLNSKITAERSVRFFAFNLVSATEGQEVLTFSNSRKEQFEFLSELGFEVVHYEIVDKENLLDKIEVFRNRIESLPIPSDGLVLVMDDMEYSKKLGTTSKFPRDSMAFKWKDETALSKLIEIEWSPSRTGLINPVAVFEPVELEGTTVSRASVHNLNILEQLKLGVGDEIVVYKANMIIPQIAENRTQSGPVEIPQECPVCSGRTQIKVQGETKTLYCSNEDCQIKKIKSFSLLVSRDALNVDGLSEATLEKFIQKGLVHSYADLFHLKDHKDIITQMEGFGEKSFQNLIQSFDSARKTVPYKILYGMGIPNVGLAGAKLICRFFDQSFQKIEEADLETISSIGGIGPIIADSVLQFFQKEENKRILHDLLLELELEEEEKNENQNLSEQTIVITGNLEHFENRNELKEQIESRGGKVAGSVSSKTNVLINNDSLSGSSKNKKARELNIPIMTEEEFLEKYLS